MKPHLPLITATLLILSGSAAPSGAPDTAAINQQISSLKPLPPERWDSAEKPKISSYPNLARMTRTQGEVVMLMEIGANGKCVRTSAVSGAAQLVSFMESYLKTVTFSPLPADGPGPWSLSITASFDLSGFISMGPTGRELTPQRVSCPELPIDRRG